MHARENEKRCKFYYLDVKMLCHAMLQLNRIGVWTIYRCGQFTNRVYQDFEVTIFNSLYPF